LQIGKEMAFSTNPRCQGACATKFCVAVHIISGPSVWNLLHITFLVQRLLRWLILFGKFVNPCF